MKRLLFVALVTALSVSTHPVSAAQSGNDLFQKALSKERVEGQLAEAIVLYERVVREFASDRALAAKALLQMGHCYERLGKTDARKAYERLLREFADQRATADEARARLAAMASSTNVPRDVVAKRIWSGPEITAAVAVSRDGRLVSFVDWETGDLAVRDLGTRRSRRLTAAAGTWHEWAEFSAFSPDGRQVAYTWFVSKGTTHYQLRVIATTGGTARTLYDHPDVEYVQPAAWTPDGKAIVAVLGRTDRSAQIALISTSDGAARILKTLNWRGPTRISLSPDGRWIAYDAPANEAAVNGDIFLLETSGARETVLERHAANDMDPVWTPDGGAVVFISDRTGALAAWLVRVRDGAAEGAPELVKADLGRRNFPLGFSAGAYVYAVQTGGADISVVALDPETGSPIGTPAVVSERFVGTNSAAGWSRDGRALVFVSDRGARYAQGRTLVIHTAATGDKRELSVPLATFRTPVWSDDDRSLLFVGRDDKGREGLFRFELASGRIEPIVQSEPGLYVNWADWMPGGREVIYSAPSGTRGGNLVRRDVGTGREALLFKGAGPIRSLAISPNGEHVAFHERGLKLVPTRGGPARTLLGETHEVNIPGFRGLGWTGNGRYVLFGRARPAGQTRTQHVDLWRIDVESGHAEPTGLSMGALRDFAIDRSGRSLAFASGPPRFEIWALENLVPAGTGAVTLGRR